MNEDYKELVEYLDKKFIKVDEEIIDLKENVVDLKTQVLSIEKSLQEKSDKSDINNLTSSIDAYAHKADTYFQEMVMLSHKVDRHEKWLQKLAEKLGVKLEY